MADGGATPEDGARKDAGIDRRKMLKRGAAGVAAAGIVWSAPKVDGLSLRPDYASAASGPTDQGDASVFTIDFLIPGTVFGATPQSVPIGAFGNIELDWTQNQGGPSVTTATVHALSPSCVLTSLTFDGRAAGETNHPNVADSNVVVNVPTQTATATWGIVDGSFYDGNDDLGGGTAHLTITCT